MKVRKITYELKDNDSCNQIRRALYSEAMLSVIGDQFYMPGGKTVLSLRIENGSRGPLHYLDVERTSLFIPRYVKELCQEFGETVPLYSIRKVGETLRQLV